MKKLKLGIKDYILHFFCPLVYGTISLSVKVYIQKYPILIHPKGALRLRLSVKQVSSACFSVTFLQYTVPMLKKEKYVNRRLSMVCTNFLFTGRISIIYYTTSTC